MFFLQPQVLFLFQPTMTSGSIHGGDEFALNSTSQMKLPRHLPLIALIQQYLLMPCLSLLPLCAMLYYYSADCVWQEDLWAGLTASSCLTGMCPSDPAGILLVEELGLVQLSLVNSQLVTSHNSISDFSGQSCPAQTTVRLPISYSPSPTVVAYVSLLPFSQFTQPNYLLLLPTWAPSSQQQGQLLLKRKSISHPHNFTGMLFPDWSSITPHSFCQQLWYHYGGSRSSLP